MKKELFLNLVLTLGISIVNFLQNKYFIFYLGPEALGIIKLFNQLFQYINIAEMGIGTASTYALYRPLNQKNIKEISIIITTIKNIYNKIAMIILGIGLLSMPFLPIIIKDNNFDNRIFFYWFLYLINTVSTYLYIKYVILFTANQEFIIVKIIQSLSKICYQILQIILLIKFQSLILFLLLLLLDNLTQYIFFKFYFKRKYNYIYSTKEQYSQIKGDIKKLFWHKIGGLVVFNTDLILISRLVSIEIVGIYASYLLIFQMLKVLVNIIYNVINPKIGKYISENNSEDIYNYFKRLNILFIVLGIFLIYPTFILINDFVELWIGKEYKLEKITIILICINYYIDIVRWVLEAYKNGFGFFDDTQSPIYESIINLFISITLGMKYGLNGIIMGTIISNVTVILIYKPILVFKRCFAKDIKEYIKVYGNYLILLLISLFWLNITTKPFIREEINSWLDWIVYATTISLITGVVLFIVFLLNKEFRDIIKVYLLKNKNI